MIVADSLSSRNHGKPEYSCGNEMKIVVHRRLPLAIATAGVANLPIPEGDQLREEIQVRDIIREIMDSSQKEDQIGFSAILGHIETKILPRVREADRVFDAVGLPESGRHVDIIIANNINGSGGIIRYRVSREIQTIEGDGHLACSGTVNTFYEPLIRSPSLYGDQFQNRPEIVRHLRSMIEAGVAFEASQVPQNERRCGGPINAAIVDNRGARMAKWT